LALTSSSDVVLAAVPQRDNDRRPQHAGMVLHLAMSERELETRDKLVMSRAEKVGETRWADKGMYNEMTSAFSSICHV
jgi:hypothetical protein